jgi:acid stress-induced BolA-like protein IbaG/YrbA
MNQEDVRNCLANTFTHAEIIVQGEGNKFDVHIVSDVFAGLTPVKRQQHVYACINEHIASGAIHAITMKLYTKAEWEKARHFRVISG